MYGQLALRSNNLALFQLTCNATRDSQRQQMRASKTLKSTKSKSQTSSCKISTGDKQIWRSKQSILPPFRTISCGILNWLISTTSERVRDPPCSRTVVNKSWDRSPVNNLQQRSKKPMLSKYWSMLNRWKKILTRILRKSACSTLTSSVWASDLVFSKSLRSHFLTTNGTTLRKFSYRVNKQSVPSVAKTCNSQSRRSCRVRTCSTRLVSRTLKSSSSNAKVRKCAHSAGHKTTIVSLLLRVSAGTSSANVLRSRP